MLHHQIKGLILNLNLTILEGNGRSNHGPDNIL